MGKTTIQVRVNSAAHYVLGAIFLIPLLIGVIIVSNNKDQTDQANQVSRDIASMYAQGVDFSNAANQRIAVRVADGLGIRIGGGAGVLILSKIRVVSSADCQSAGIEKCVNKGVPVIMQRFVIGSANLRPSSFGNPAAVDPRSGAVTNWATDPSARAQEFYISLKPGESTYAAECYLSTSDAHAGVYSRAMF
jgi:hypothetical protein